MAKLKFDAKKLTGIFGSRFEIIGLIIAGVLVSICLVWGLSTFLGASSPEGDILKDVARLEQMRKNAPKGEKIKEDKGMVTGWPAVTDSHVQRLNSDTLFLTFVGGPGKRVNPAILNVDSDPKSFQLDYILKGVCEYDFTPLAEKLEVFKSADAANNSPVLVVGMKRFVVVNCTFSYQEQIELHRKALLQETIDDMFVRGIAPTIEGLNVERRKITFKDGKEVPGNWEPLYGYDSVAGKVKVHKAIAELLVKAAYDIRQVDKYKDVIHGMSVSPLPKLMSGEYPEVDLPGIKDQKPQKPKGDPKKIAPNPNAERHHFGPPRPTVEIKPANEDRVLDKMAFLQLPEELRLQLTGKINWFSPYGTFTQADSIKPPDDPKDGPKPLDPKDLAPKSDAPVDAIKVNSKIRETPPVNPKALIRFIDADVEPGNAYQYRIKLRFANPNYRQNPAFLLFAGLANQKELLSAEWTETPTISIPANSNFNCYVVNQERHVSQVYTGKPIDKQPLALHPGKYAPFQIHKFFDTVDKYFVADWLVAERLLVPRGEQIGRDCDVEIMSWNKKRMQWQIAPPKKGTGVSINFRSEPPLVLLDFAGGPQTNKLGKAIVNEDCAFEALVLLPDMTMKLKNTQEDAESQERRSTFDQWKSRMK